MLLVYEITRRSVKVQAYHSKGTLKLGSGPYDMGNLNLSFLGSFRPLFPLSYRGELLLSSRYRTFFHLRSFPWVLFHPALPLLACVLLFKQAHSTSFSQESIPLTSHACYDHRLFWIHSWGWLGEFKLWVRSICPICPCSLRGEFAIGTSGRDNLGASRPASVCWSFLWAESWWVLRCGHMET
jgi:hypothetical protein